MQQFELGQVWAYQTRRGEEASRLLVWRVEKHPKFVEVVHIQVYGLRLKSKQFPDGAIEMVGHMPYLSAALRACVTGLEASGVEASEPGEGYEEWRRAFVSGKAGVWTVPLAEALDGMEAAMGG